MLEFFGCSKKGTLLPHPSQVRSLRHFFLFLSIHALSVALHRRANPESHNINSGLDLKNNSPPKKKNTGGTLPRVTLWVYHLGYLR